MKNSIPNSIKSLGHIKCHSWSSLRPIKSPSNSLRHNCQKSAIDREDLKPYWKSEKRPYFFRESTVLLFRRFSKTSLTTEKSLTEFLAVDISPTFLNTGTTDETFQQSGKHDSFRNILKSSASMYES